jgi:hypothetical protein
MSRKDDKKRKKRELKKKEARKAEEAQRLQRKRDARNAVVNVGDILPSISLTDRACFINSRAYQHRARSLTEIL